MAERRKARALALVSGGLDSLLAVRVLQEQGVAVTGLSFVSPFYGSANAERAAKQLGIELLVVDLTEEAVALVKDPPHGFGKGLNPCIDCHALMVRRALTILARDRYDFIATGEVLNERPMSQNRQSLEIVARDSGAEDLLVRPLSAKLLPPTGPEREGLIDRERLLAIEGRSRKPQMALAKAYGFTTYVQPAGGCLLTDPAYCARLRELLRAGPGAGAREMRLLRLGRHFRLPSGAKAIVGRDERDNERIEAARAAGEVLVLPDVAPGPTVLLVGPPAEGDIDIAARLCASFSDHGGREVEILVREGQASRRRAVRPEARESFSAMRI